MSIAVELADLGTTLEQYPWGYLVTVADDQQARVLAVSTRFGGGVFTADAGRSARANAAAHPSVTLVFPPASGTEYSL
ncbi:MAG: pyridoxamine 5'-phosphate oxidase family protein, partial [Actinobacteria bacterium]|nr:pyridoxamine 5'-phosphate oxidase family protein [Actinomycetota bacterium]